MAGRMLNLKACILKLHVSPFLNIFELINSEYIEGHRSFSSSFFIVSLVPCNIVPTLKIIDVIVHQ